MLYFMRRAFTRRRLYPTSAFRMEVLSVIFAISVVLLVIALVPYLVPDILAVQGAGLNSSL